MKIESNWLPKLAVLKLSATALVDFHGFSPATQVLISLAF